MSASAELLAKLNGRRVVASISGGKDSAALSLHLRELGIEHDRVFMDTGWEHPATYEYLRGELPRVLGPITWIRAERQMEELIRAKGMFPSRQRRFCTQELKVFPMQRHLRGLLERDPGTDLVNAVGIRHQESAARADMPEWEWSEGFDCETWRPLVKWTEADVILTHKRQGLAPNPLYLRGASRVGCWPCIYARKAEIRLIADMDPERIDRIRALEAAVAAPARERYERDRAAWQESPDLEPNPGTSEYDRWAAKRDRLARPFHEPAWFQAPMGRVGTWSIDKVVDWSRTDRGGRQYGLELFDAPEGEAGCVRWGLCETSAPDKEFPPKGEAT